MSDSGASNFPILQIPGEVSMSWYHPKELDTELNGFPNLDMLTPEEVKFMDAKVGFVYISGPFGDIVEVFDSSKLIVTDDEGSVSRLQPFSWSYSGDLSKRPSGWVTSVKESSTAIGPGIVLITCEDAEHIKDRLSKAFTAVQSGYSKTLHLVGTGYKYLYNPQFKVVTLYLGYSHPIQCSFSEDIHVVENSPTSFTLLGLDKQKVGNAAYFLQLLRRPNPYDAKGVHIDVIAPPRKKGKDS